MRPKQQRLWMRLWLEWARPRKRMQRLPRSVRHKRLPALGQRWLRQRELLLRLVRRVSSVRWARLRNPPLGVGSGLSGSGAFQTMPTSPVAPADLSMPSAQQIQGMKTVAGQLQGNNQQAPAAPGGGVGPRGNSNIQMANMSTPAVGARPSLAQLLYGRR